LIGPIRHEAGSLPKRANGRIVPMLKWPMYNIRVQAARSVCHLEHHGQYNRAT